MSNLALNDFNPNTHRIDKSNKIMEIYNILIFFGYRNAKFFAWLAPATPPPRTVHILRANLFDFKMMPEHPRQKLAESISSETNQNWMIRIFS